jgi:hypothetical protein
MTDDPSLLRLADALDQIEAVAAENVERGLRIQGRIHQMREQLGAGVRVADVVASEPEPRTVELISTNMAALEVVGSKFRASLALALRDEGLTVEAIGELFGVSRQRISALLRQRAADEAFAAEL